MSIRNYLENTANLSQKRNIKMLAKDKLMWYISVCNKQKGGI